MIKFIYVTSLLHSLATEKLREVVYPIIVPKARNDIYIYIYSKCLVCLKQSDLDPLVAFYAMLFSVC